MTVSTRLPPAYRLVVFDEIDSTNAEARRRAEDGAEEGTLVVARRQSAGRGRRGRHWRSPEGNLYMSLLLRPDRPIDQAARYSFVSIVALGDAVASLVPPLMSISFKWPNDLLLHGRKCAGVLLESAAQGDGKLDWLVIGLGVNLTSHPRDVSYPATDLAFEGADAISANDVLEGFSRHFLRWNDLWMEQGFAPIRAAWLARAHGLGEPIEVRLDRERFTGRFDDIDDHGALIVTLDDGSERRIAAGDVFPVGS